MKNILIALCVLCVAAVAYAQVQPGGVTRALSYVLAIDGSAAAPSISFQADTGTGFRRAGSGAITIDSAGSDVAGFSGSGNGLTLNSGVKLQWGSSGISTPDLAFTRVAAGEYGITAVLFAALGTPANGTFTYCSDCTIANPCAGSGTGAFAKRLNGVWVCN